MSILKFFLKFIILIINVVVKSVLWLIDSIWNKLIYSVVGGIIFLIRKLYNIILYYIIKLLEIIDKLVIIIRNKIKVILEYFNNEDLIKRYEDYCNIESISLEEDYINMIALYRDDILKDFIISFKEWSEILSVILESPIPPFIDLATGDALWNVTLKRLLILIIIIILILLYKAFNIYGVRFKRRVKMDFIEVKLSYMAMLCRVRRIVRIKHNKKR